MKEKKRTREMKRLLIGLLIVVIIAFLGSIGSYYYQRAENDVCIPFWISIDGISGPIEWCLERR